MVMFFPSIHPTLLSSCRNAVKTTRATGSSASFQETDAEDFPGCCALAIAPPKTSVRKIAKIPTTHFGYFDIAQYRFWIADFRLPERNFVESAFIGVFLLALNPKSKIENPKCHLMTRSA